MAITVECSRHAYKRGKKRFGLGRKAVLRLATTAYIYGTRPMKHRKNRLFYRKKVFIFDGAFLVTLYKMNKMEIARYG